MRTVEASRFVPVTLPEVERLLTPGTIIEYEGTFTVRDVTETDDGWLVTASAPGMEVPFAFEEREDGYAYRYEEEVGPFEAMETTVTAAREDEGVRVTMRSTVSLRLPLPFADRIGGWKRRGELRRALDRLARDLE